MTTTTTTSNEWSGSGNSNDSGNDRWPDGQTADRERMYLDGEAADDRTSGGELEELEEYDPAFDDVGEWEPDEVAELEPETRAIA